MENNNSFNSNQTIESQSTEDLFEETPKERNGFVSFWLWMCLVLNAIVAVACLCLLTSSRGLFTTPEPIIVKIGYAISSVISAVGFWMLLQYKRAGFVLLCALQIINAIVSFVNNPTASSLLAPFISLLILYGILHITKDGVSCWDYLD